MRFRKPCRKCDEMFRPTGKYSSLCPNCYVKAQPNRKRYKLNQMKGGKS